jgi:mycothiol system anti-sigma-R factor
MDCEKAVLRMYYFLDGEITVWRRWRISRHLRRCPPCANGFDFEIELRQIVATRCRDQIPAELRARIAQRLAAETEGDRG